MDAKFRRCCSPGQRWLLVTATSCLLILTCLQAAGSIVTRNIPLVSQSRGYSIFLLRAMSELAGLLLSTTIATTFSDIKWAFVCRRMSFVDFLALQQETSILGLLSLATAPGMQSRQARVWSVVRLVSMVLIPVIGILIMSQVDIQLALSPVAGQESYLGYGNLPMNASMAPEYTGFADLLLSWKLGSFLGDSLSSVDLTPEGERSKPCGLKADTSDTSGCRRRYLLSGESLLVVPELVTNASFPEVDVILVGNHRSYLLDFDAGDATRTFDPVKECRVYSSRWLGVQAGAIRICAGNSAPNELQGRLVTCPGPIASTLSCQNDTSWWSNVDWTVKMTASFQHVDVAYSRSNSTIVWHSLNPSTPAEPANVTGSQILQAYDALLLDTTQLLHQNGTPLPLFSGSSFPAFLWMASPQFSGETATNPATRNGMFTVLQSLLALPMYYCQSGVARRLIPAFLDTKAVHPVSPELDALLATLSPLPPRNSPAAFVRYRFDAVASRPTLVAYAVIGAAAVLACAGAQTAVSLAARGWRGRGGREEGYGYDHGVQLPRPGPFPALDLLAHCSVQDENQLVVYQGRSGVIEPRSAGSAASRRDLLRRLGSLSVGWAVATELASGRESDTDVVALFHLPPAKTVGGGPAGSSSEGLIASHRAARQPWARDSGIWYAGGRSGSSAVPGYL